MVCVVEYNRVSKKVFQTNEPNRGYKNGVFKLGFENIYSRYTV
jgi:hypothetical protein